MYKRIYVDLPGMGKSVQGTLIKNSDDMLDILIEVINKILPNENFLLAGESYGGYLSLGLIYKMGSRIDGLLLICPAVIADIPKRNLPPHKVIFESDVLVDKNEEIFMNFKEMATIVNEQTWQRYQKEILPGIESADATFLTTLAKEGYPLSFESKFIDLTYNKETLVFLGRQDHVVGYKDCLDILDIFDCISFVIADRAGHNLQIEVPELFSFHVKGWLAKAAG